MKEIYMIWPRLNVRYWLNPSANGLQMVSILGIFAIFLLLIFYSSLVEWIQNLDVISIEYGNYGIITGNARIVIIRFLKC